MQRRSIVRHLSACLLLAGIAAGFMTAGVTEARAGEPIVVFAAASLRNVLDDMIADWHRAGGGKAVVSYAGTSALARQIEQGAPADILISADEQWMQYLVDNDAVAAGSVEVFARNRVVLIAPTTDARVAGASGKDAVVLDASFPLQQLLGANGRFAMANPSHVPAGRYGKAALQSAGLFELASPHLTRSANVRLALALVARGECPVGLVYASDAHAEPAVRIIGRFQPETSPPVIYPAALIKHANTSKGKAAALLTWLLDPARGEYLQRHGLLVPAKG